MSRILVVGGTGFLGKNLCRRFIASGHEVHSLSRAMPSQAVAQNVMYLCADLADAAELKGALKGAAYDFVINCGGKVDHRPLSGGGAEVVDTHLIGLLNLLQALDRAAVKRFVQIGSSDQYGSAPAPQSERVREAPFSPYSFAKTAADHLLQMLWRSEKFPAVSLRLFLIYGPGQNRERFLPQIIEGCLDQRAFNVSPGLQKRDFCYVADVVDAIGRCLDVDAVNGEVLNLASGESVTIREVVERIRSICDGGEPNFGALPYRPGENMALYADILKIREILDWTPSVSLDEGLRRTVDYYLTTRSNTDHI